MSGYVLHPEAFTDLDAIREYIAEDNPDAADRVITEIFDGIRGLVASPWTFHPRAPARKRIPSERWLGFSKAATSPAYHDGPVPSTIRPSRITTS